MYVNAGTKQAHCHAQNDKREPFEQSSHFPFDIVTLLFDFYVTTASSAGQ